MSDRCATCGSEWCRGKYLGVSDCALAGTPLRTREQSNVTATSDGIVTVELDLHTAALVLETLDADDFRDNLAELRQSMRAVMRNFWRYRNL